MPNWRKNYRSGSENRHRKIQIGLRLSQEEAEELKRLADDLGMKPQQYIRYKLFGVM